MLQHIYSFHSLIFRMMQKRGMGSTNEFVDVKHDVKLHQALLKC
jgi:hypothetical protein